MQFLYNNTVVEILYEFCRALIAEFAGEFISPDYLTPEKVDECVKGFEAIVFPQCLGAIDGCYIEVKPAAAEAVDHHNYKGWYSIVIFALVDYRYRFTYANIGSAMQRLDYLLKVWPSKKNRVFAVPSGKKLGKSVAYKFRCCLFGALLFDFPQR